MRKASKINRRNTCSPKSGGGCYFSKSIIQPKLNINEPGDAYEQEADNIANKVMQAKDTGKNGTFFSPKPLHTSTVQKKSTSKNSPAITSKVSQALNSTGQSMDHPTRNFMESRFGHDFSNVQIHNDSTAHESATDINAKAYTNGNHVVFGSGQYQPGTDSGKQLLAHELTHVIQQGNIQNSSIGIQRKCSGTATGNSIVSKDKQKYEDAVKAGKYCKDTGFSGSLHEGADCYREVSPMVNEMCPEGDQVCISPNGDCEESRDMASPVESRDSDGSCNLGRMRSLCHFAADIISSERVIDLAGYGLFMGTGVGRSSNFARSRTLSTVGGGILGMALGAAAGSLIGPATRYFARKGYVPTVGVSAGFAVSDMTDAAMMTTHLYFGTEQRDKAVLGIVYPSLKLGIGLIGEPKEDSFITLPRSSSVLTELIAGIKLDPRGPGGSYISLTGGPAIAIDQMGSAIGAVAGVSSGYRWRWFDFSADAGITYDPTREAGMNTMFTMGLSLSIGPERKIPD